LHVAGQSGHALGPEPPGSSHRVAATVAGAESDSGALWRSEADGVAQAGGLASGKEVGLSAVWRRRAHQLNPSSWLGFQCTGFFSSKLVQFSWKGIVILFLSHMVDHFKEGMPLMPIKGTIPNINYHKRQALAGAIE
jgi:hypothetical protein